jgi:hypothetical protein
MNERENARAINKQASMPIISDLAKLGYEIEWISDLYSKKMVYKSAIPVLLYWVERIDNPDIKETLIRTLSVRWAKPDAAPILIKEYKKLELGYSTLKWTIGNALLVVADDKVLPDLAEIALNKDHGKAREMVVLALGNIKKPEAVDVLIALLSDDEVSGFSIMALGKLKVEKAYPLIEPFLYSPKTWIRKEASRALRKIRK